MTDDQTTAEEGREYHTIRVSSTLWRWALRSRRPGEGPATFLREVLVEAMYGELDRSQDRSRRQSTSSETQSIHVTCYERLVENCQGEIWPDATLYTARFQTLCPQCRKPIMPGTNIVVTSTEGWT